MYIKRQNLEKDQFRRDVTKACHSTAMKMNCHLAILSKSTVICRLAIVAASCVAGADLREH